MVQTQHKLMHMMNIQHQSLISRDLSSTLEMFRHTYIHTSFPTVCFLENAVKLLLEPELFRGDRAHGPETRAWTRGLDRESGSLPLQHCSNLPSRVTTKDLRLEINKPIFLCYRWPTAHRTHRKQILSSSEIVLEHCLRR